MSSGADTPAPPTAIMLIARSCERRGRCAEGLNAAGIKTGGRTEGTCRRSATRSSGPERIRVEVVKRNVKP
jgi:hypothetical protein